MALEVTGETALEVTGEATREQAMGEATGDTPGERSSSIGLWGSESFEAISRLARPLLGSDPASIMGEAWSSSSLGSSAWMCCSSASSGVSGGVYRFSLKPIFLSFFSRHFGGPRFTPLGQPFLRFTARGLPGFFTSTPAPTM
ncbi:hypothetical protein J4Q44_G00275050 [Coregonus suidteri]|uniref:Uncharacterized protein n=1 Tax=Coregonus suidteri TaxID=861788 RepID=A0AAN8L180_9TELE